MRTLTRPFVPLAVLAAALVSSNAVAAEAGKKVTVLFTGDNGGEVAPCG